MTRMFGGLCNWSVGLISRGEDTAHLATPPGTLHGSLVTKNDHLFSFLHISASFSKSNSSPIGQPQPLRRIS